MFPPFSWVSFPVGVTMLSALAAIVTYFGTRQAMRDCDLQPGRWPCGAAMSAAGLSALFLLSVLIWQTQSTPEVQPSEFGRQGRAVYHLALLSLLTMITVTDLKSYYIVNWCCWLGLVIGLTGAFLSGEFQLAHVWVDWNAEIPQLRGPDFPSWLAPHPHLHGLAWSLAGAVTGVVLTGLIRWVSSSILGLTTLGSGDVMLMAMIGSFLGWQPTVVVTLLAPMLALLLGGVVRLFRPGLAIPYGPFLALAAVIVMFCWRAIWMMEVSFVPAAERTRDTTFALRRFFGDPVGMLIVFGLAGGLFVVILGLLRFYRGGASS